MDAYETHKAIVDGVHVRVEFVVDDSGDAPWERDDGHGEVSDWRYKESKRPGERILCTDHGSARFYDWQGAIATAKRDWIGPGPFEGKTRGQAAVEAVEADFAHLRGWCNNDWFYMGIVATVLDQDGAETRFSASCWGIESNADDYIGTTADACADEAVREYLETRKSERHLMSFAVAAGGGSVNHRCDIVASMN